MGKKRKIFNRNDDIEIDTHKKLSMWHWNYGNITFDSIFFMPFFSSMIFTVELVFSFFLSPHSFLLHVRPEWRVLFWLFLIFLSFLVVAVVILPLLSWHWSEGRKEWCSTEYSLFSIVTTATTTATTTKWLRKSFGNTWNKKRIEKFNETI